MKLALTTSVAGAILCMPSMGGVFSYDGLEYETIHWEANAELGADGLSGSANGVDILFSSAMSGDPEVSYDYNSGAAFDALSYGDGVADSVSIFGGQPGMTTLNFSEAVGSVLIFIGAPTGGTGPTEFGSSIWDFDDSLEMSVIDSALEGGFDIGEGNVLTNPNWGPTTQNGGVIGVFGDGMTSLEWLMATANGVDKLQITVAIAVPAPASGLALLLPAALIGRRRR